MGICQANLGTSFTPFFCELTVGAMAGCLCEVPCQVIPKAVSAQPLSRKRSTKNGGEVKIWEHSINQLT